LKTHIDQKACPLVSYLTEQVRCCVEILDGIRQMEVLASD
jgi:metal-sulfur cluster biosynthetic enzyme